MIKSAFTRHLCQSVVREKSVWGAYSFCVIGSGSIWVIKFLIAVLCAVIQGESRQLVGRTPDSWSKGREFEPRQERRENFLLQSQLCVLILIRCPFHPRVTTVAHKRPRSFCQKCRRQVTPEHAFTLDLTKSESELTMLLCRHSVEIYQETSSHASRQTTLSHSRLSSLNHCGLILAKRV